MKRPRQIRLACAICFLEIAGAKCQENKLIQPLWPANEQVCREAWDHNFAIAQSLLEQEGECRRKCTDRKVNTPVLSGAYDAVCGGNVSGLAMFADCQALDDAKEQATGQAKQIDAQCLAAVQNRRAAETVWDASKRDSTPEELRGVRDATDKLNDEVTTGSAPVDAYREEARNRAINAASTLQSDNLNALKSLMASEAVSPPSPTALPPLPSRPSTRSREAADCDEIIPIALADSQRLMSGGVNEREAFSNCGGSSDACQQMIQSCESN